MQVKGKLPEATSMRNSEFQTSLSINFPSHNSLVSQRVRLTFKFFVHLLVRPHGVNFLAFFVDTSVILTPM